MGVEALTSSSHRNRSREAHHIGVLAKMITRALRATGDSAERTPCSPTRHDCHRSLVETCWGIRVVNGAVKVERRMSLSSGVWPGDIVR